MWEKILKKNFDKTDIEIMTSLNQDGRITDQKIANRLGISKTSVRTRRLRLQKTGAIKIIALLVLQNMSLSYADVLIQFKPDSDIGTIKRFVNACASDEYIYEISEYVGAYDLLLRFFDRDLNDLKEHIISTVLGNKIISNYTVFPVVRSYKAWGNTLSSDD
jgi:DNA-binding Lrp family transcriptional regulator